MQPTKHKATPQNQNKTKHKNETLFLMFTDICCTAMLEKAVTILCSVQPSAQLIYALINVHFIYTRAEGLYICCFIQRIRWKEKLLKIWGKYDTEIFNEFLQFCNYPFM